MESKINGRNKIEFEKHYICDADILRREPENWNMTKKNQTKQLKKQSAYSGNDGGKNTKNHLNTG